MVTMLALPSVTAFNSLSSAYYTNFSTVGTMRKYDVGCFDCSANNPDECAMNFKSAVAAGSIANGTGLTITTTRRSSNFSHCSPIAGGSSGYLTFKPAPSFGTIRVKSKYFPGAKSSVKTAKGFIGLEGSSSGAITITMHGAGASPSGAPAGADWTQYMQSSCYQHGQEHTKTFTNLGHSLNSAGDFNTYENVWPSTKVTISVNGNVVRTATGSSNIPQGSMHARIHSRSIRYSQMGHGDTFTSYADQFHYIRANGGA